MHKKDDALTVEQMFGRSVKELRARKGWSQQTLADHLSGADLTIDTSGVSRMEKGTRALRLSEAVVVAEVLDTTLESLLAATQDDDLAQAAKRTIRWTMDHQRELYRAAERAEEWSQRVRAVPDDVIASLPRVWQGEARSARLDPAKWLEGRWAAGQGIDYQEREQAEGDQG